MFTLGWGIHCEFRESTYGQGQTWAMQHACYTSEFAKWLKENNIKVAMHNLETMEFNNHPWIIFERKEDEMFFKLAWT